MKRCNSSESTSSGGSSICRTDIGRPTTTVIGSRCGIEVPYDPYIPMGTAPKARDILATSQAGIQGGPGRNQLYARVCPNAHTGTSGAPHCTAIRTKPVREDKYATCVW